MAWLGRFESSQRDLPAEAPHSIRPQLDFFDGTLAPFLRASESPIAIACLRLFTLPAFPRLPERSVPLFLRRMALATDFPADLLYFRPPDRLRELDFFFAGMQLPPGT